MAEILFTAGLPVYGYGLCAALAGLCLLALTALFGKRKGLPAEAAPLLCVLGVPFAVIFARLVFAAVNLSEFTEGYGNLALALRFWDGGLSMTGALLGLLPAGLLTAKIVKKPFSALADAAAPGLMAGIALLRLGERFTDLGVGKSVEAGFFTENARGLFIMEKMGKAVDYRMAVSKYEFVAFLLLFAAAVLLFARMGKEDGHTALMTFSAAAAVQILLESLRDDGHMLIIFLRVGQVAAGIALLVCLAAVCKKYRAAGGGKNRVWIAWLIEAVCMGGIVLIEFALDGRLAFGARSMGVNYLAMAGCCLLMLAQPAGMLLAVRRAGKR